MKRIFFVIFVYQINPLAFASQPAEFILNGLTASCASCHGLPGEGKSAMSLYGYSEQKFIEKFKLFQNQSGIEKGVMHYIAKGYSDEEIRRLAAHFAKTY